MIVVLRSENVRSSREKMGSDEEAYLEVFQIYFSRGIPLRC